jgi:hypothetical protein
VAEFTAKNYPIRSAPKRIELLGDKTKRPEPAQHVIEFPGGAIELTRCSDGVTYWAHIIVHRGQILGSDGSTRESMGGEVVDSRVDTADGVVPIPGADTASQIAVLVRAVPQRRADGGAHV